MKVESVQIIPMSKESKWEDIPNQFEVFAITTDFTLWFDSISSYIEESKAAIDEECIAFAKRQAAYMTAPTAMFGDVIYIAKTILSDTLENVVTNGPLYAVMSEQVEDRSAEKTAFKKYIDPKTFEVKEGLWYPMKKRYKIRYGVRMY